MKATAVQQQALLDLAALDLEIARNNRGIAENERGSARDEVQATLAKASEVLLAHRHAGDELASEIDRVEQDLELVERRIESDKSRLQNSSSPKDIQGIQHELVSLEKRKSALEELELELLERRDANAVEIASANGLRQQAASELEAIDAELETLSLKLRSGLSLLQSRRQTYVELLTAEQLELYSKLLGKTLPVARLDGLSCGACNLNLSGATVDEIRATPKDELARCPECAAMLVTI